MAEPTPILGTIGVGINNAASISPGLMANPSLGPQQDQLVTQLHGQYFEQCRRNNRFFASVVGQVTTVGLATTYTGLCLSNPLGSGKLIVVDKVSYAFLVAFAAASAVGIMVGYSASTDVTHTTPVTVRQARIGGAMNTPACVGKVDSAATLSATPVIHTIMDAGLTGAITTTPKAGPNVYELGGGLILEPGAFAAIYTSTASGAASMGASWKWHEISV